MPPTALIHGVTARLVGLPPQIEREILKDCAPGRIGLTEGRFRDLHGSSEDFGINVR
jgi:hypothetical protein